ncbi:MAG: cell division protein ZapA [Elusimicrobiota bacterium]
MAKKTYNLRIEGSNISVDSDLDDLTMNVIERTVNQKMKEILSSTDRGTSHAAILAALETESEKLAIENDYKTFVNSVDKKAEELINIIDTVLEK